MLNWNESFNWTREQFDQVVKKALVDEKKRSVALDVEHADWRNMQDIMKWAREAGYKAIEINSDTIRVYRDDEEDQE